MCETTVVIPGNTVAPAIFAIGWGELKYGTGDLRGTGLELVYHIHNSVLFSNDLDSRLDLASFIFQLRRG